MSCVSPKQGRGLCDMYHAKKLLDIVVQPLRFLLENLNLVILDLNQAFKFMYSSRKSSGILDQPLDFTLQNKKGRVL